MKSTFDQGKKHLTSNRSVLRQSQLSRVLKGAKAAGVEIDTIEVRPDGSVAIRVNKSGGDASEFDALSSWERSYNARQT